MWPFRNYVCVRQLGESDCGAAALATVVAFHGGSVTVSEMRERCGTDRSGTTAGGLVEGARWAGFEPRVLRTSLDGLHDQQLPVVAQLSKDGGALHWVVVLQVSRRRLLVADPALGFLRIGVAEFERLWTGVTIVLPLRSSASLPRGAERPSPARRVASLAWDQRRPIALAAVLGLLCTGLAYSTSLFVRHVLDSVLPGHRSEALPMLALAMTALLILRFALLSIRHTIGLRCEGEIESGLMTRYFRSVFAAPLAFLGGRRAGEILARAKGAQMVRGVAGGIVLMSGTDLVFVLGTLAVLFSWRPGVAAILLASMLSMGALFLVFAQRFKVAIGDYLASIQARDGRLIEDLLGMETIKALRMEGRRSEEARTLEARYRSKLARVSTLGHWIGSITGIVGGLASILLLWLGGGAVLAGALSIGDLVFLVTLLGLIGGAMDRLAGMWISVHQGLIAIDHLGEVLDAPTEAQGTRTLHRVKGGIRLEGVTLKYGRGAEGLRDVTLDLPIGARMAIVGGSGSGKSSVARLLTRLYDPTEGQMLIDGAEARDFTLESLRRRVVLVPQEPFLFHGSVAENIAIGRPNASQAEIVAAAKLARVHEFLDGLPAKYNTLCGERGKNLSAGQRQRIALARAFLTRPDVLILDEATSHLDPETERALLEGAEEFLRGRAVLTITHRLWMAREADRVVFMDNGRVLEQGSHEELVAAGGRYAGFWQPVPGRLRRETDRSSLRGTRTYQEVA